MTNITNNSNISVPLAVWLAMDNYNVDTRDNVISATTLLKPIRQIVLGRKYRNNIKEIDVENLIASSMGTALHDSVEKAWKQKDKVLTILEKLGFLSPEALYDEVILERRSEVELNGYIISGQFDIAFKGIVCDIKSTSVWSHIFGSKEEDYILQLSIYKYLNQDIITNEYGYIEHIFTDWSQVKAMQDKSYPQKRILSTKLKLYSNDEIERYMREKIALIAKYEALPDSLIPKCSQEELWQSDDVYKYYKDPTKMSKSTKNFTDKDEADEMARRGGGIVVTFGGEAKRCAYCSYTNICSQYEELKLIGLVK